METVAAMVLATGEVNDVGRQRWGLTAGGCTCRRQRSTGSPAIEQKMEPVASLAMGPRDISHW